MYGLASADGNAGAVLRERGVTPDRVEAEFVRLIGQQNTASGQLGAEHIALALLAMDNGVPHRILSVIGASAQHLGAEIRDRCQQAAP